MRIFGGRRGNRDDPMALTTRRCSNSEEESDGSELGEDHDDGNDVLLGNGASGTSQRRHRAGSNTSRNRKKRHYVRLGGRKVPAGTAPARTMIQAKQNQMYLITTLLPSSCDQQALINRVLPKELLLRVFSYLDIITLCRCAQTCRQWNCLALDGSNWQHVDLFSFQKDVKAPVVENLARRCGGFLKNLSLKGCENVQDNALRSFTHKCPNIESLSLSKCKRVTDVTCENLGRFCHRLTRLDLENCTTITDRAMRFIGDGCKNLEFLNISWCDNIQDRGLASIANGCQRLEELVLKGCDGLTENCFNDLSKEKHFQNLRRLNLLGCFITDATITKMAELCPLLEYLCLSTCTQLSDAGIISLSHNCHQLKVLELAGCSLLSDTGFASLAKYCHDLESMDLEDCSLITDVTINNLHSGCPNLANLTLSHCELITDVGLEQLCNSHRNGLKVLELDNCPLVTDNALDFFRAVASLERVDLYDCQQITKDGIGRFKQFRPDVEVHAYFAPSTPPTSNQPARNAICRCCVIL
ncbi:hypothetical protein L596_019147 [Steinernema carpocapsae]|uniref:F-box domain-containing protein n=1 Tax=Steinernema carpocapsae TaxID=34508 RepID=A0A4U5N7H5_STECR|nr:hypothetical protein L596_019147 [Steinernema carpocapsae]